MLTGGCAHRQAVRQSRSDWDGIATSLRHSPVADLELFDICRLWLGRFHVCAEENKISQINIWPDITDIFLCSIWILTAEKVRNRKNFYIKFPFFGSIELHGISCAKTTVLIQLK